MVVQMHVQFYGIRVWYRYEWYISMIITLLLAPEYREYLMMDHDQENSAHEMQADLSEIERDLTLRRLLWESQEEWDRLASDWTASAFDVLNVDNLQKNVNRFTQTVYMLDKGQLEI